MRVKIISETIQEFEDRRYYRCGRYFQRKGKRLHRAVWESTNGPVPHGFHVHHLDHDATNNQPNNLGLLRDAAHLSHHGSTEKNREHFRQVQVLGRQIAPEWHRSAEGRAWHSANSKATWPKRQPVEKRCEVCGKSYQTWFPSRSRFCHQNCKAVALRRRRATSRMRPGPSPE